MFFVFLRPLFKDSTGAALDCLILATAFDTMSEILKLSVCLDWVYQGLWRFQISVILKRSCGWERFFWRKKLFRLKWCHEHPLSAFNCMLFGTVTLWMICYFSLFLSFRKRQQIKLPVPQTWLIKKVINVIWAIHGWTFEPPTHRVWRTLWLSELKRKN